MGKVFEETDVQSYTIAHSIQCIKTKEHKLMKRCSIPFPCQTNASFRDSLAVQWLGISTFTTRDLGSISGLKTKIPQVLWCGQKNKINNCKLKHKEISSHTHQDNQGQKYICSQQQMLVKIWKSWNPHAGKSIKWYRSFQKKKKRHFFKF